jgi:hypothetical protein
MYTYMYIQIYIHIYISTEYIHTFWVLEELLLETGVRGCHYRSVGGVEQSLGQLPPTHMIMMMMMFS